MCPSMWEGMISVTTAMSQFLGQPSHSLKSQKTASCQISLHSVNIIALQEALPTLCVLHYEFNNNAERCTDGC